MTAQAFVFLIAWLSFTSAALSQTTNYDFNLQITGAVYTISLQPDSKILVGNIWGPFRLQTNGAIDPAF
jgi:hypothetical protein